MSLVSLCFSLVSVFIVHFALIGLYHYGSVLDWISTKHTFPSLTLLFNYIT